LNSIPDTSISGLNLGYNLWGSNYPPEDDDCDFDFCILKEDLEDIEKGSFI